MNYQRIYNQIIERAKLEDREKRVGVYYELHHILPRCLEGSTTFSNLILLTAREHFICHKLLCDIHPGNRKLINAYWMMANMKGDNQKRFYKVTSKEYERLKSNLVQIKRELLTSNNPMHRQEVVEKLSGVNHWNYGGVSPMKGRKNEGSSNNMISNNPMFTAEGRDKVRQSKLGSRNPRAQAVLQLDKETNNVLSEYSTIQEAYNVTKIVGISGVCRGVQKSAGGFKWQYKKDYATI